MWIILGLIITLTIYISVLVLLVKEWHKQNPHWYTIRVIHFIKTYWAWPVIAAWIIAMLIWELHNNRKVRKVINNNVGNG